MDCCHPALMGDAVTLDALLFLSTGFFMSLGHCVGMCGPLIGAYALAQGDQGHRFLSLLPAVLIYHTGRLTSYAVIGLIFGLIGSATRLGDGRSLQGGLALVAGLLMLLLGLGLAGWLPTQRWVESGWLSRLIGGRIQTLLGTRRVGGRYLLGVANGFLPCGPVYAMAIGTVAAARPLAGAGAMAIYGLGTLPVLLILGLGAGRLAPSLARGFTRVGALLVVLIGVQLILRGAAVYGWVGHLRWGDVVIW